MRSLSGDLPQRHVLCLFGTRGASLGPCHAVPLRHSLELSGIMRLDMGPKFAFTGDCHKSKPQGRLRPLPVTAFSDSGRRAFSVKAIRKTRG